MSGGFAPFRGQPVRELDPRLEQRLRLLEEHILREGRSPVNAAIEAWAGGGAGAGEGLPDLIPEGQVQFDATDGHDHDGAESKAIALAGDVTGTNTAALVAQVQGVPVADPAAGDDGQFARYNHGTPNITWETPAGSVWGIATKTGNYTLTDSDWVILVDATAGAVVITLHAVATAHKHPYTVKKIDASVNTVTIDGNGGETIDDAPTQVIATQYEALTLHPDGTEWWIG